MRGKNRPTLSRGPEATTPAAKAHFEDQLKRYGKQFVINLLSKKDEEKIVGESFEQQVHLINNPDVRYRSFDFYEQLGSTGLSFHLMGNLLLDPIQPDLEEIGVYGEDEGKVLFEQKGTFRINCLDCLDRTNVCQWQISKRALIFALQQLEMLPAISLNGANTILTASGTEEMHKQMWANNGDALSVFYTGTGAIKSNVTRTGRTPSSLADSKKKQAR